MKARHFGLFVTVCLVLVGSGFIRGQQKKECLAQVFDVPFGAERISISPDGKYFALFNGWKVYLRDLENKKTIPVPKPLFFDRVFEGVFWKGSQLLTINAHEPWEREKQGVRFRLFDLQQEKEKAVWDGHKGIAHCLGISPHGQLLATGGGLEDRTVIVWEIATQKKLACLPFDEDVEAVSFNKSGALLCCCTQTQVTVWNTKDWSVKSTFKQEVVWGYLTWVGFLDEGTVGLKARVFRKPELFFVKDLNGKTLHEMTLKGQLSCFSLSPNSSVLAIGVSTKDDEGKLTLWDHATKKELTTFIAHTGAVNALAFSPDGRLLYSNGWDGRVKVWDVAKLLN